VYFYRFLPLLAKYREIAYGTARPVLAWHPSARLATAGFGTARHDYSWNDTLCYGTARHGSTLDIDQRLTLTKILPTQKHLDQYRLNTYNRRSIHDRNSPYTRVAVNAPLNPQAFCSHLSLLAMVSAH